MKVERGWAYPDIDDFMVHEMKDDGSYQAGHLRLALAHVTDWSCAVDGGAHVGTWSKPMSAKFAKVLAFEPSKDTVEALKANMQAFGCTNVEIHHAALGATAGAITMRLDGRAASLKNTGGRYAAKSVAGDVQVPRVTIDSLNLPTLGFLKLDVEGSEPYALEGALDTLARCRPIVLFENKKLWQQHFGLAADAPHQILTAAGYREIVHASCDVIWGPA